MSEFSLEVGKTYFMADQEERSTQTPIPVLGKVLEGTLEYEKGYRYFTDLGFFYTSQGRIIADRSSKFDLVKVMDVPVSTANIITKHQLDVDKLKRHKQYVDVRDPSFSMSLGGIYVNNMGFLLIMDTFSYSVKHDNYRFMSSRKYYSPKGRHLVKGRKSDSLPSMEDIVYKRV